jgi:hypothetical protein
MPVHDWSHVEAGVFHHFHHAWIEEMARTLNAGVLPGDYYALSEQHAGGFGPDVLTLQSSASEGLPDEGPSPAGNGPGGYGSPSREPESGGEVALLDSPPQVRLTAETDMEFYRRKQSAVVVRHVSGDRVVAVVEIVSPGNKSGRAAMASFVEKAAGLLDQRVHLLILDLQPPTHRDPEGIHGLVWEYVSGQQYTAPPDKPLTLAAYESALSLRAYVEPVAVGDVLRDMPLYLQPRGYVSVPLEDTYQKAFDVFPRRWRSVLEGTG